MAQFTRNSYRVGSRCNLKSKKKAKAAPHSRNPRLYILAVIFFAIACSIIFKLYFLQVRAYDEYKALADNQHSLFQKLVPKRGEIYIKDRNDLYPVAVNKEVKMAYAVPKEIEDGNRAADLIADALGLDKNQLRDQFSDHESMYQVLKHKLSDEEADRVQKLKLKGIYLSDESYRYYPAGELAAQVLGFEGWKDNDYGGRYGLELYLNDDLKGQEGSLFHKRDNSGSWVAFNSKEINYAQDGDSFVLTIDRIIQYETEKILASAINRFQAERGTIIVMEVPTGKILSMANYPTFDPNNYAQVENMEVFRNLAVSDSYECGSIFKTITLASAVDAGKITPDSTYNDTGAVTEAGYTIKNSDLKAYGAQTMTQVLEKSLNTGAIYAEKLMGNRNFADYVQRFGFGEDTGVSLYGESAGNIKNLNNLRSDIQFFTASFGQGITVTPIQFISAINAIANGGVLMKPQIIEKTIHADGNTSLIEPQEIRRVISQKSAMDAAKMLQSVVEKGHGKKAAVPGYLVGGKTGTAQVASSTAKGYEEGKTIGSFAGFAPVDNPQYTILVRMDNPKGVQWAESSAGPTFGELMKFLLEYENVEPTEKFTQKDIDAWNATHTLSQDFIKKDEDKNKGENNNIGNDNNQSDKDKKDKKR